MKIEQRKTSGLIPYEQNPRMNDAAVAAVAKSIKAFGFRVPIIVDSDGVIVCGHTRRLAAVKLGLLNVPVHVATDLTPEQVRAYRIADNQTASIAEWDVEALSAELAELAKIDFDLDSLGFDKDALDELLANAMPPEPPGPDVVPEPPADPISKTRDLWLMGEHRLLCGDCRESETANTGAVIYDPPWDSDPTISVCGDAIVFCDAATIGCTIERWGSPLWVFAWDCVTSWYLPNRPLKRMKLALWYGDWDRFDFNGTHYGEPGESKTVTNSRGQYDYVADPRGKHLTDVFVAPITQEHSEGPSHSKPLDWIRLLIGCCTKGDVYDPFSGSGTTIIACEQLNRKCYAIEIEPRYVDVAVIRWQNYTGKTATRESDGLTFNECIHA